MTSTDYPDFDWHERWVKGQARIAELEQQRVSLSWPQKTTITAQPIRYISKMIAIAYTSA